MASVSLASSTARRISHVLSPLREALDSADAFAAYLRRFGWAVAPSSFDIADVRASLPVADLFATVDGLLAQIDTAVESAPADVFLAVLASAIDALDLARGAPGTAAPAGIPPDAWAAFTSELLDQLVFDYVAEIRPAALAALVIGGVVTVETVSPPADDPRRVAYRRVVITWEGLARLVTSPPAVARDVYGWGDPNAPFRFDVLLARLAVGLSTLGLPAEVTTPTGEILDGYYSDDNPLRGDVRELRLTIMQGESEGGAIDVQMAVLPIPDPADPGGAPRGLVLRPQVVLTEGGPDNGLVWPFSLTLSGFGEDPRYDGGRLEVGPSGTRASFAAGLTELDAGFRLDRRFEWPALVAGSDFSHRIEVGAYAVGFTVRGNVSDPDVTVFLEIADGRIAVDLGDADQFLGSSAGRVPITIEFGGALLWSTKTGFHLRGSGGLEVVLPLNISVAGALFVRGLNLGISASEGGIALRAGASATLIIGPIAATVQGVGVALRLDPVRADQSTGVFGRLDARLAFLPPTGVGLSIDAGPVSGGGFLTFEPDRHRYSGALALRLGEIEVNAFGLIETRLPGGAPGFSFAIIISSRFTPIPLGFGFTLNGVGGLLGVNRTIDTGALQAAVRSHTLDHVLFPQAPEKNAPEILESMRAIFPAAEGRFVFGPMAIIGWGGSVPIMEAELGVIFELPPPIRLAVVGQVKVGLPSKSDPLVRLNFDVVGVLDTARKSFAIDASLYDSNVGAFPVSGNMAMRLTWGDRPNFALAVGGFHPQFRAPAGFPALERVRVDLAKSGNPRISILGYLAITPNSVQLGARAEIVASKGSFNVQGWIGFDAIVVVKPLSFRADFSAGVALRKGSKKLATVTLKGTLSGPNPWHAKGEACISLFFFDVCVGFDVELGGRKPDALPAPPDLLARLEEALQDRRNWASELPGGGHQTVTIVAPAGTRPGVLLDPLGSASVRQRVLPLERKISRFENVKLAKTDVTKVTITATTVGGEAVPGAPAPVLDQFARAQFEEMKDAAKLSLPAFEPMVAGVRVAPDEVRTRGAVPCDILYETTIIDAPGVERPGPDYVPAAERTVGLARRSAGALAGLTGGGVGRYLTLFRRVRTFTGAEPFTIAGLDVLAPGPLDGVLAPIRQRLGFVTKSVALEVLRGHVAGRPDERRRWQVVPDIELRKAA